MQRVAFRCVNANCLKYVKSWHVILTVITVRSGREIQSLRPCDVIGPWQHLHILVTHKSAFYYGYRLIMVITASRKVTIHHTVYSSDLILFFKDLSILHCFIDLTGYFLKTRAVQLGCRLKVKLNFQFNRFPRMNLLKSIDWNIGNQEDTFLHLKRR